MDEAALPVAGARGLCCPFHPCYDFNDDALPYGVRWFCAVAQRALAPSPACG